MWRSLPQILGAKGKRTSLAPAKNQQPKKKEKPKKKGHSGSVSRLLNPCGSCSLYTINIPYFARLCMLLLQLLFSFFSFFFLRVSDFIYFGEELSLFIIVRPFVWTRSP